MLESEAMAILVGAGVSYGRREAALRAAGSALAILAEPGLYAAQLQEKGLALLRHALADEARLLGGLAKKKMALVLREDAQYPPLLRQIAHPPHLLYVYGETDLTDRFPVAVVGTRRASAYGLTHTREIAAELAQTGVCVVSGLALGIDAAAHTGALDGGGRTVAVLGSALDKPYPQENEPLMRRILAKCEAVGALLAVDECFLDFLPDGEALTMKPELAAHGGLFILKAFTKLYGMAGVRLGYGLCADAALLDSENLGDSALLSRGFRGRDSYTYTALPNQVKRYTELVSFLRMDAETPSDELSAYLVNESQYNTFVYDAYTALPESVESYLTQELGEPETENGQHMSYQMAKQRILEYLTANASYTEMPKETRDDGEDFLRFFLESGAGYSVHYATAAALMLSLIHI